MGKLYAFNRSTDNAIQRLYYICRVDRFANIVRLVKQRIEVMPVIAPRFDVFRNLDVHSSRRLTVIFFSIWLNALKSGLDLHI
ncbi:hypothetical protein A8139_12855 [Marinomonas primoryensis]|uniref:Uncharacterized protein n=1 Tax=Marinomonas primoryensis TaxID=178399 RepID=A0A2Z4PT66_9GAMM|nr:hypothetical protein A8139_12855 [Marinomonas primoryensis]